MRIAKKLTRADLSAIDLGMKVLNFLHSYKEGGSRLDKPCFNSIDITREGEEFRQSVRIKVRCAYWAEETNTFFICFFMKSSVPGWTFCNQKPTISITAGKYKLCLEHAHEPEFVEVDNERNTITLSELQGKIRSNANLE